MYGRIDQNTLQVIWILQTVSKFPFIDRFCKRRFVNEYLTYLSELDFETILNDDIGSELVLMFLENNNFLYKQVICFRISLLIRTGVKITYDERLWNLYRETYEELYNKLDLVTTITGRTTPSDQYRTLTKSNRKILAELHKAPLVTLLISSIRNRDVSLKPILERIYARIKESQKLQQKRGSDSASWKNWKQTNFKQQKFPTWLGGAYLSNIINKWRFVRYHIRFFRYMKIENIIGYEVGAKLVLLLLNNTSLNDKDNEFYLQLKFCINCHNMINNSTDSFDDEDYFETFIRTDETAWFKYSNNLERLHREQEIITLNKHLYIFLDEKLSHVNQNPKLIWLLNAIWGGINYTSIHLELIYDDMFGRHN